MNEKKFAVLIIIGLILFYGINNYIWNISSSPTIINENEAHHLKICLNTYSSKNTLITFLSNIRHCLLSPIYQIVALSPRIFNKLNFTSVRMMNLIWFLIILIAVYRTGKYLFSIEAGLYSIVLLSFYPIIYGYSRMYRESFGLIGPVVLCILFLLKSDRFTNTKYTILFALSAGIGILIRKTCPFFILGPVLYIFSLGLKQTNSRKKALLNTLPAITIFIIITGYRFINKDLLLFIMDIPFIEDTGAWYKYNNLEVYTTGLINRQLSLPFFLVFFYGLIKFARVKKEIVTTFFLWFFIPFLFFTLIPHENLTRNILPYIPVFALISGFGIAQIKNTARKKIFLFIIVFIGILQYYEMLIGLGLKLEQLSISVMGKQIPYFHINHKGINGNYLRIYKNTQYNEEFFYSVANNIIKDSGDNSLLLLPPTIRIDNSHWQHFIMFNSFPFNIILWTPDEFFIPELVQELQKADYILFSFDEYTEGIDNYLDKQIISITQHLITLPPHLQRHILNFENYITNGEYEKDKLKIIHELKKFKEYKKIKKNNNESILLKRTSH